MVLHNSPLDHTLPKRTMRWGWSATADQHKVYITSAILRWRWQFRQYKEFGHRDALYRTILAGCRQL